MYWSKGLDLLAELMVSIALSPYKTYSIQQCLEAVAANGEYGEVNVVMTGCANGMVIKEIVKTHELFRQRCLREKKDLLILDSDVIIPKDGIKKLVEANVSVITGLVKNGGESCGWSVWKQGLTGKKGMDWDTYGCTKGGWGATKGVIEAIGSMGFMLVKNEVLDKFEFTNVYGEEQRIHDMPTFMAMIKAGIKLYVHTDVECVHLLERPWKPGEVRRKC